MVTLHVWCTYYNMLANKAVITLDMIFTILCVMCVYNILHGCGGDGGGESSRRRKTGDLVKFSRATSGT